MPSGSIHEAAKSIPVIVHGNYKLNVSFGSFRNRKIKPLKNITRIAKLIRLFCVFIYKFFRNSKNSRLIHSVRIMNSIRSKLKSPAAQNCYAHFLSIIKNISNHFVRGIMHIIIVCAYKTEFFSIEHELIFLNCYKAFRLRSRTRSKQTKEKQNRNSSQFFYKFHKFLLYSFTEPVTIPP